VNDSRIITLERMIREDVLSHYKEHFSEIDK
jgi:hypothetical protein